jgi:hypothetical protein
MYSIRRDTLQFLYSGPAKSLSVPAMINKQDSEQTEMGAVTEILLEPIKLSCESNRMVDFQDSIYIRAAFFDADFSELPVTPVLSDVILAPLYNIKNIYSVILI